MLDKYNLLNMQSSENIIIIINVIDIGCRFHSILCFATLTAPAT